ncbi:MAG: hypothetical protein R3C41_14685 [Calditrichia bacterium]
MSRQTNTLRINGYWFFTFGKPVEFHDIHTKYCNTDTPFSAYAVDCCDKPVEYRDNGAKNGITNAK